MRIFTLLASLVILSVLAGCNEGFVQPEPFEYQCEIQYDTTYVPIRPKDGERGNIFKREIRQVSICPEER